MGKRVKKSSTTFTSSANEQESLSFSLNSELQLISQSSLQQNIRQYGPCRHRTQQIKKRKTKKNGEEYKLKDSHERWKEKILEIFKQIGIQKQFKKIRKQSIKRDIASENPEDGVKMPEKEEKEEKGEKKIVTNRKNFDKLIKNRLIYQVSLLGIRSGFYEKLIIKAPRKMSVTQKHQRNTARGLLRDKSLLTWKLIEKSKFYQDNVLSNKQFDSCDNIIQKCTKYYLNTCQNKEKVESQQTKQVDQSEAPNISFDSHSEKNSQIADQMNLGIDLFIYAQKENIFPQLMDYEDSSNCYTRNDILQEFDIN